MNYRVRYVGGWCLALLLLLGMSACRETSLEDVTGVVSKNELTIRFSQLDGEGAPVQELGAFGVSLMDPMPFTRIATIDDLPLERPASLAVRKLGGSTTNEVLVYVLLYEPEGDAVNHYRAVQALTGSGAASFAPWLPGTGDAASTGTLYAFFVRGVGDQPDVPVEVRVQIDDDVRSITVSPSQHTLSPRFALRVNKDDLVPLRGVGTGGGISIAFEAEGSGRRIKPLPLYAVQTEDGWRGGVGVGGNRANFPYFEPLDQLEFYLMLLDL